MIDSVSQRIAEALAVKEVQVAAAVALLDEGSTVPFIARYRKEATGGLDDTQLRALEEKLHYLRELDERRATVLSSIEEQEKLTPELKKQILAADTKTRLEDLYLPYKKKRRTKAQIAREAGLEPLALLLFENPDLDPEATAVSYIDNDKEVPDIKTALEGARQILMEIMAEDADLLARLRGYLQERGVIESKVVPGKEAEGAKFSDYFDYSEPLGKIPSHRALAIFRGRNEAILQISLTVDNAQESETHPCEHLVAVNFGVEDKGRAADKWLLETVRWAWRVKIFSHLDLELKMALRTAAETEAINVFASNLSDLLLAAPAGPKATLGLDPGLRTGVKIAVVDATGKVTATDTIYPHAPRNQWDASMASIASLCVAHNVELISIGNGTASRETDRLVKDMQKKYPELNLKSLIVSEAGASVYSASELGAKEFPDMDVSLRGAVSIARRLQDPLAELVKIEPKSIGVGQYQHDVSQFQLSRTLETVVEDCVNKVGVDLNTASVPLLNQVSGLTTSMAENIVDFRDKNGPFSNRKTVLDVPRIGPKAFEQAAGFLRIMNGDNPLDRSAVHPEAYPVVESILQRSGKSINSVLGDRQFVQALNPKEFVNEAFGLPTVTDILVELEKPGRDPRPEFKTAAFQEGVESIKDLKPDMILEGVISNVANFGAFVDLGVHQDGLVHISAMSDSFVKDPRTIVKAGDVVKVKVMEIDLDRKRIGLSMRLTDDPSAKVNDIARDKPQRRSQNADSKRKGSKSGAAKDNSSQDNSPKKNSPKNNSSQNRKPLGNSAMADAFSRARKK